MAHLPERPNGFQGLPIANLAPGRHCSGEEGRSACHCDKAVSAPCMPGTYFETVKDAEVDGILGFVIFGRYGEVVSWAPAGFVV
jgi:hypothetical protein